MKKLFFASAALCAAASISAQEVVEAQPVESTPVEEAPVASSKKYRPESGRFGVEAAIDLKDGFSIKDNDYTGGKEFDGFKSGRINAIYSLSDQLSVRCGFGLHVNKTYKHDDVTTKVESETIEGKKYTNQSNTKGHTTNTEFEVLPGIVYSFAGTDRLEPYIGAELVFGFDKTRTKATEDFTTTDPATKDYNTLDKTTSTGVYFGANGFTGFNFYLCKDLFIGAELGFGFKTVPTDRIDGSKHEDSRVDAEKEKESDDKHFGHTTEINLMFSPSVRLGWKF